MEKGDLNRINRSPKVQMGPEKTPRGRNGEKM